MEWLEPRALLTAVAMTPPAAPGTLDTAFGGTGILQSTPAFDQIYKVIAHADHTVLVGGYAENDAPYVYEGFLALDDAKGSPNPDYS